MKIFELVAELGTKFNIFHIEHDLCIHGCSTCKCPACHSKNPIRLKKECPKYSSVYYKDRTNLSRLLDKHQCCLYCQEYENCNEKCCKCIKLSRYKSSNLLKRR